MFAQKTTVDNDTPNVEASVNLLGLFYGNYSGKIEVPVTPTGFFSVALCGTYNNQEVLGESFTGYDLFLNARLYPSHQMRGVYFGAEGGFSSFTYGNDDDSFSVSSIPVMALIGYKWAINKISLDLGFASGKQIYIGDYDSDTSETLNSFPFNFSYDFFFLVGYRF